MVVHSIATAHNGGWVYEVGLLSSNTQNTTGLDNNSVCEPLQKRSNGLARHSQYLGDDDKSNTCGHHNWGCDGFLGLDEGSCHDLLSPSHRLQYEGGIPWQSGQVPHIHSISSHHPPYLELHLLHLSSEKAPPAIHSCLLTECEQHKDPAQV
jgi:hypothetical protein